MPSICIVSHERTSASNYYRVTLPVRRCAGQLAREGIDLFVAGQGDQLPGHDAYVFSRAVPLDLFPFLTHCVASGVPIAYDVDDLFSAIPEWSPAHAQFTPPFRAVCEQAVGFADLVSASTEPLREALGVPEKTTVLPNLIEPADWPEPSPRRPGRCMILWQGSNTHEEDLRVVVPALRACRAEFGDRVDIAFAGYCPKWIREDDAIGAVFLGGGWPVEYHARALSLLAPDIGIAPLSDSPGDLTFNRCKSAIKVWEYAMAGACPVASDVGPYDDPDVAVLTGHHDDLWTIKLRDRCRGVIEWPRIPRGSGPFRANVIRDHSWDNPTRASLWLDHFRRIAGLAGGKP